MKKLSRQAIIYIIISVLFIGFLTYLFATNQIHWQFFVLTICYFELSVYFSIIRNERLRLDKTMPYDAKTLNFLSIEAYGYIFSSIIFAVLFFPLVNRESLEMIFGYTIITLLIITFIRGLVLRSELSRRRHI